MLNLTFIKSQMQALGLTQSALAQRCGVSRETVSQWLAGEFGPRPSALLRLAETLQTDLEAVLAESTRLPFATRWCDALAPHLVPKVCDVDHAAQAQEFAGQLRTLCAYLPRQLLAKPQLRSPELSADYLTAATAALGLTRDKGGRLRNPAHLQLVGLHQRFGSILIPVYWPHSSKSGAVVALPDEDQFFVYVNLRNSWRGVFRTLAESLGYCHAFRAEESLRTAFADRFADTLSIARPGEESDIVLPDSGVFTLKEFVELAENMFGTPVYQALKEFQYNEGGRNPAYLQAVLGIPLADALELSYVLCEKETAPEKLAP
jgi:transcriptional regulator with XRE-family HTH domain